VPEIELMGTLRDRWQEALERGSTVPR